MLGALDLLEELNESASKDGEKQGQREEIRTLYVRLGNLYFLQG